MGEGLGFLGFNVNNNTFQTSLKGFDNLGGQKIETGVKQEL